MTHDRSELRQKFRQARRGLTPSERAQATDAIYRNLDEIVATDAPSTLAAFAGNDGEVDLLPWLGRQHGTIALPRIIGRGEMSIHTWQPGEELEHNRFGIAEPSPHSPRLEPEDIDLMLMPLVAFDARGNRLGMGGGYYDRFLASHDRRPRLVGIAFACQQTEHTLPAQSWDVGLHTVVTEHGIIEFPTDH